MEFIHSYVAVPKLNITKCNKTLVLGVMLAMLFLFQVGMTQTVSNLLSDLYSITYSARWPNEIYPVTTMSMFQKRSQVCAYIYIYNIKSDKLRKNFLCVIVIKFPNIIESFV